MYIITRSLIIAALVAPCATAQRQPPAPAQMGALPDIGAITTDRGRISDRGGWHHPTPQKTTGGG